MSPEGNGSLNRVLFASELAFLKILIPRLPQNTSDINAECAGKPKQLYSYYSLFYFSDINKFLIDYVRWKL